MVRDTGIGIKKEDSERVFLPLGKLEATAHINTSGVGLGLSTCKKILEALSGSIHLNDEFTELDSSELNYATSIALMLPCAELATDYSINAFQPDLIRNISEEESKNLNEDEIRLTIEAGPENESHRYLFDNTLSQSMLPLRGIKHRRLMKKVTSKVCHC